MFTEVYQAKKPVLSFEEASAEANRCIYCYDAPCIAACPTSINIPQFIARIAAQDNLGSAQSILSANILGASCSTVCPVEVLCEGSCVYNKLDNPPIAIGRLQKYALHHFFQDLDTNSKYLADNKAAAEPSCKVAAIGSGPASLSFAAYVAMAGGQADIYESNDVPGGLNSVGIAPYKLNLEDSLAEIELIKKLGVSIHCGTRVDGAQAQQLLRDNDALFLGTGLASDSFVIDQASSYANVYGSLAVIDAIKRRKHDFAQCRSALVIGGGNTALDVVQELALVGVGQVIMAYRRDRQQMSGYAHELDGALKLGVDFRVNHQPLGLITQEGKVTAVRFATPEGEQSIETDIVVFATGQLKHPLAELIPQLQHDARGCVQVDAQQRCSVANVYAGGDCANGGKEVVNAVAEGRQAAYHFLNSVGVEPGFGQFTQENSD